VRISAGEGIDAHEQCVVCVTLCTRCFVQYDMLCGRPVDLLAGLADRRRHHP
jgi:hypothetical protein